jgi:hypothetical protein
MNYSVELKINGVDYSEYIQLPFSITETLDETMDTGAMTLNFLEERTPFKPYSECEITLTQPDNVPKKYTMLLESDKVEEIQHGNDSFWKHNLTFIETTYLLSNYYLPDFAITQPITAFAFPKAVPSITEGSFNETLFSFTWPVGRLNYSDKFVLSNTSYAIKTKYISPLNLSNTIMRNWAVNFITTSQYGSGTEVYDSGQFSYTYYYKLHSASTWTEITDLTSITLANGIYDIKAVMDTDFTYHYKYTSSLPSAYTINWEDRTGNASGITGLSETILYENIEVADTTGAEDTYTIKEGIEKVLSVAKLEEIGEDYDFITLDENAVTKNNLDTLKCPEMTITNGQNVLEVMYKLGREFNAIPRLLEGNKLSFDVLENPEDNSTYQDGTELEQEEANMTNYANVLVSNVTNMTSSERTKVYPGAGRFISCRADPNETTLQKDNMSILVDDNINYLVKVKVKNWLIADPTLEQDITGYIFEKTLYDSLNKNPEGQGLALYYEKGKNKIVGLGMLPQIQSYLGWGADEYIIERILNAITGVAVESMEDPLNFLYQVEYVPYVDAQIIIHQTNIANFDADVAINYNQETANINAEAFGTGTQKVINRIGNNSINKLVRVNNISEIPYVGEHKEVDGEMYFAEIVNTTYDHNDISVAIQYSKDFNKINNRVSIDKEYREYSLYANNFVNRTVNVQDFCEVVLSTEAVVFDNVYGGLARLSNEYANLLGTSTSAYIYDAFKLVSYKADGTTKLQYTPFRGSLTNINEHIVPASLNVIGNSVLFVGSCYDNYSVGQYIDGSSYAFGKYANKDARYVDDKGECPVIGLTLGYTNDFLGTSLANAQAFPIASNTSDPTWYLFKNRKFVINKDNRERLKLAYSVNFYTRNKSITIHKGAIKYFFKSSTNDDIDIGNLKLIGYNGDIKNKDIVNYESNDILNDVSNMSFYSAVPSLFYLKTAAATPTKNYSGFALIWGNTGELLYSFKQTLTAGVQLPSKYIYFNFMNKKVDGVLPTSI